MEAKTPAWLCKYFQNCNYLIKVMTYNPIERKEKSTLLNDTFTGCDNKTY